MNILYLSLDQILEFHSETIRLHGGSEGVRDMGLVQSALAQPEATFDGEELYPDLVEKASALAFSFAKNHGFIDGNKRIALASLEMFLRVNGYKIDASIDDAVEAILAVASSTIKRDAFTDWIREKIVPLTSANNGS